MSAFFPLSSVAQSENPNKKEECPQEWGYSQEDIKAQKEFYEMLAAYKNVNGEDLDVSTIMLSSDGVELDADHAKIPIKCVLAGNNELQKRTFVLVARYHANKELYEKHSRQMEERNPYKLAVRVSTQFMESQRARMLETEAFGLSLTGAQVQALGVANPAEKLATAKSLLEAVPVRADIRAKMAGIRLALTA